MAKLNQIIAIEKGIKSRVYAAITAMHKASQKPELFNGFIKEYQPKDEDADEILPPERKRVQYDAKDVLKTTKQLMSELMLITARKDWTNCVAKGTIIVDGKPLLENVPVTYLLFLEKQLTDIRTFVGELPILDDAESWIKDENTGLYKTESTKTHRTKKIQKPIVMYHATPEHPAQTQMITEDIIAGFWSQIKHSGALPKIEKEKIAERVEKLLQAIKQARESANSHDEVTPPVIGDIVFGYLFP